MLTTTKIHATILDDDEVTCRVLKSQLVSKGFSVRYFLKSSDLLMQLDEDVATDVFILDYTLLGDRLSGLDVCRKIKAKYQTPVAMLTGNKNTDTVVSCIAAGADLYLEKPYELETLTARIRAISRLYKLLKPQYESTQKNHFELDECIAIKHAQRLIESSNGLTISLTEKELAFFELISSRKTMFISREEAYLGIYGRSMDPNNRAIDNLACRVRAKIKKIEAPLELHVIRGVGYRLVKNNLSPHST